MKNKSSKSAKGPKSPQTNSKCSGCSNIRDGGTAFHTVRRDNNRGEDDTHLHPDSERLVYVKDYGEPNTGNFQLKKCPECDTLFLYIIVHEFLASGSEDDEYIFRLEDKEYEQLENADDQGTLYKARNRIARKRKVDLTR